MQAQTEIDFTARDLKEIGMQRAEANANKKHNGWSELAFDFLKGYARINPEFMAEDVRQASEGVVPDPPSARAWGGVISRARSQRIIISAGIEQVKNPKAHMANATRWRSLIVSHHRLNSNQYANS